MVLGYETCVNPRGTSHQEVRSRLPPGNAGKYDFRAARVYIVNLHAESVGLPRVYHRGIYFSWNEVEAYCSREKVSSPGQAWRVGAVNSPLVDELALASMVPTLRP